VGLGDLNQLVPGLRQGDVKALLSPGPPIEQELQGERGLAGSGLAFDQVHPVGGVTAVENGIQPVDAGGDRLATGHQMHTFHADPAELRSDNAADFSRFPACP